MSQHIKMSSASRSPSVKWWDRIDPLTEIEWFDTVRSKWTQLSATQHSLRIHADGSLRQFMEKIPSPIKVSQHDLYNHRAIRLVTMLNEYQQLTTMQIATLLGDSRHVVWRTVMPLYEAGVVQRLVPKWWKDGMTPEESGSGSVWKLDRKSWMMKNWVEGLGGQEYALFTNASDPFSYSIGESTPTALRHNLMSAEIMIKAMESIPGVIGAWGESHLEAENLFPTYQYTTDEVRKNVGDGAIVTGSGKIIVIETSGSSMQKSGTTNANRIVEKAAAWTGICGKSDLDIYVVFVETSVDPSFGHFQQNVKYGVEQVSSRFVTRKSFKERGMSRIFVVDGREWFPISRGVSEDFTKLRVLDSRTSQPVDLIQDIDFKPNPNIDVVVNTLAAFHTPSWIHNKLKDRK